MMVKETKILTEQQKRYIRCVYLSDRSNIPVQTKQSIMETMGVGIYTDEFGRWMNRRREIDTKGTPYESIWIELDKDGWDTIDGKPVTYNTMEIRNEITVLRDRYGVGRYPLPHGYFIKETPQGRMKICKLKK